MSTPSEPEPTFPYLEILKRARRLVEEGRSSEVAAILAEFAKLDRVEEDTWIRSAAIIAIDQLNDPDLALAILGDADRVEECSLSADWFLASQRQQVTRLYALLQREGNDAEIDAALNDLIRLQARFGDTGGVGGEVLRMLHRRGKLDLRARMLARAVYSYHALMIAKGRPELSPNIEEFATYLRLT